MKSTTILRGYGYPHKKARARYAKLVRAGLAFCARCGKAIHPLEAWDLGHNDFDRRFYSGPEHIRCNRATAGRKKVRSLKIRKRFSRKW